MKVCAESRRTSCPIVEQLEQQTRSGERAQVVTVGWCCSGAWPYPLVGDGSIADVVSLAGGYTDSAYLEQVEVRRIFLVRLSRPRLRS